MDLKEPFFVSENAPEQGMNLYEKYLSELYELQRVVISPCKQGYKNRRWRQYIIGKLKALNLPVPSCLQCEQLPLHAIMETIFMRSAAYSYCEYACATEENVKEELEWSRKRPAVVERYARMQDPAYHDEDHVWKAALTQAERKNLEDLSTDPNLSDCSYDFGQRRVRLMASHKDSDMHTLTHSMGILWCSVLDRWFVVDELCIMMGFPVLRKYAALLGSDCSFTHGAGTNTFRTRHSCLAQVGNAMHMASIGATLMSIFLFYFPYLNQTCEPCKSLHVLMSIQNLQCKRDRGEDDDSDTEDYNKKRPAPQSLVDISRFDVTNFLLMGSRHLLNVG